MINQFTRCSICLVLVALVSARISAQTPPEPVREQLLNGLTILFWQRPDANVLLKLRVHSGAAFDLAGKGGTMALLGDALFPDPATREYVAEQLGGKLEVTTGFDAIDITISGKSSEFERLVEFLRGGLVSTQLTPENVARIRDARIKQLSDKQTASSEADQAIAARLFGAFPYGHPIGGTNESLARIERADLLFAGKHSFPLSRRLSCITKHTHYPGRSCWGLPCQPRPPPKQSHPGKRSCDRWQARDLQPQTLSVPAAIYSQR